MRMASRYHFKLAPFVDVEAQVLTPRSTARLRSTVRPCSRPQPRGPGTHAWRLYEANRLRTPQRANGNPAIQCTFDVCWVNSTPGKGRCRLLRASSVIQGGFDLVWHHLGGKCKISWPPACKTRPGWSGSSFPMAAGSSQGLQRTRFRLYNKAMTAKTQPSRMWPLRAYTNVAHIPQTSPAEPRRRRFCCLRSWRP